MKKLIIGLLLCTFAITADASYRRVCKIQYQKEYGWSDYYTVEVNFSSGTELNRATNTWDFDSYSTYAVIFWSQSQVTVIELDGYMGCGSTVSSNCIDSKVYGNMDGYDQRGVKWEICVSQYCY